MNRKIFIDCGFYRGGAIECFKKTPEYSDDFIYYGFDPMLDLERIGNKWGNVSLSDKSVWIFDGEIDFYTSHRLRGRANGVYHNKRVKREAVLRKKCIDFSAWMKANFDNEDFVILKVDIEGAEYEVLQKMIKDGTISLVDIIYLEWHSSRADDKSGQTKSRLMDDLKKVEGIIIRKSIERFLRCLKK